jgi:hypothetical protein
MRFMCANRISTFLRSRRDATVDDIVAGTRETYDGPLQVGVDLMSFEIGDTVIVSQRKP